MYISLLCLQNLQQKWKGTPWLRMSLINCQSIFFSWSLPRSSPIWSLFFCTGLLGSYCPTLSFNLVLEISFASTISGAHVFIFPGFLQCFGGTHPSTASWGGSFQDCVSGSLTRNWVHMEKCLPQIWKCFSIIFQCSLLLLEIQMPFWFLFLFIRPYLFIYSSSEAFRFRLPPETWVVLRFPMMFQGNFFPGLVLSVWKLMLLFSWIVPSKAFPPFLVRFFCNSCRWKYFNWSFTLIFIIFIFLLFLEDSIF